jgi:hypothetical protein
VVALTRHLLRAGFIRYELYMEIGEGVAFALGNGWDGHRTPRGDSSEHLIMAATAGLHIDSNDE